MNRNAVHIVLDEFHKVANAADTQLVGLHRHAAGKDQPAAFFRCGCIMNALVHIMPVKRKRVFLPLLFHVDERPSAFAEAILLDA